MYGWALGIQQPVRAERRVQVEVDQSGEEFPLRVRGFRDVGGGRGVVAEEVVEAIAGGPGLIEQVCVDQVFQQSLGGVQVDAGQGGCRVTVGVRPAVQAEKPERPLRHGVAFWLTRADGAVLLQRRPEHGLLGGMIELPSTDWRDAPWDIAEASTAAPAEVKWRTLPGTVRHGFTHFRLELGLLAGTTSDPIAGIWARPAEFKNHAFPTLTRKLVKHAMSAI